jgi:hypothetical protein
LDFSCCLSDEDEISSDFLILDVVSAGLFTIGLTDFSFGKLEKPVNKTIIFLSSELTILVEFDFVERNLSSFHHHHPILIY